MINERTPGHSWALSGFAKGRMFMFFPDDEIPFAHSRACDDREAEMTSVALKIVNAV